MKKRTMEIIAVCKGGTRYDSGKNLTDKVKSYMSETCRCDKNYYTDSVLSKIMTEAMYDFIDTCDVPSSFLRKVNGLKWLTENLAERICMAFQTVEIRSGWTYINGFNADYEDIIKALQ
ncbi:MAG: hypothetical protein IJT36_03485 [Alphaproteobacteria bacterium]|nr:hypothetical protein [Alphaproteobacteria bacterium]